MNSQAQQAHHVTVYADSILGDQAMIWNDFYEMHLMYGHGGNPKVVGPHSSYLGNDFSNWSTKLNINNIRLSIGRADSPPDTNYYSSNTQILKNLGCEFYRGANTLAAAADPSNYHFSYLDSLIDIAKPISQDITLGLDYMPFTLSSDTVPNYNGLINLIHYLAFDNSIRNSPPADTAVYGEVMYQLIKHCYDTHQITEFEFWNEPDQFPGNTFFWKGSAKQLYEAYKAVVDHLSQDPSISNNVNIGGCSFAMNSPLNLFPKDFLQRVQQNNTRMDFLSFHPYSDQGAGYDTNKVNTVVAWKNQYVPNVALYNTEWSRIDPNPSDSMRARFDYGLLKLQACFDMLDRGVTRAHQASLADAEMSPNQNLGIGALSQGPLEPKNATWPLIFMNEWQTSSPFPNNGNFQKVKLTIDTELEVEATLYDFFGLGGGIKLLQISAPMDSIHHALDTIFLEVHIGNQLWSGPFVNRKDLTMTDALNQASSISLTESLNPNQIFRDTVINQIVQENGTLFLWEFNMGTLGLNDYAFNDNIKIFPNPTTSSFTLELKKGVSSKSTNNLTIVDMHGRIMYMQKLKSGQESWQINKSLPTGNYLVLLEIDGRKFSKKLQIL